MAVDVRIPSLLKPLVGGARTVSGNGATVAELLTDLEKRFPGIGERLLDSNGNLKQFVNIFVNEEDIRFTGGLRTALKDGDVVSILPAIVGGCLSSSPPLSPSPSKERGMEENPKGRSPFGAFSIERGGGKGGEGKRHQAPPLGVKGALPPSGGLGVSPRTSSLPLSLEGEGEQGGEGAL